MTEPTTLQMPVSQTAREILEKLHPAIKDDWRLKLLKVEDEAINSYERQLQKAEGHDPDPPQAT